MKKGLKIGLVFGTLLMLTAVMFAGSTTAGCGDPPTQRSNLVAGQKYDAGYVEASVDGATLTITFVGENGWTIDATHLWVGDDFNDLPLTKKGNIKVGKLPYKGQMTYTVPLPADTNGDGEILIVAHAVVGQLVNGCEWEYETAWANTGNEIPGVTSWALYFPYTVA